MEGAEKEAGPPESRVLFGEEEAPRNIGAFGFRRKRTNGGCDDEWQLYVKILRRVV